MLGVIQVVPTIPATNMALLADPMPIVVKNTMASKEMHHIMVNPLLRPYEDQGVNFFVQDYGMSILNSTSPRLLASDSSAPPSSHMPRPADLHQSSSSPHNTSTASCP